MAKSAGFWGKVEFIRRQNAEFSKNSPKTRNLLKKAQTPEMLKKQFECKGV